MTEWGSSGLTRVHDEWAPDQRATTPSKDYHQRTNKARYTNIIHLQPRRFIHNHLSSPTKDKTCHLSIVTSLIRTSEAFPCRYRPFNSRPRHRTPVFVHSQIQPSIYSYTILTSLSNHPRLQKRLCAKTQDQNSLGDDRIPTTTSTTRPL